MCKTDLNRKKKNQIWLKWILILHFDISRKWHQQKYNKIFLLLMEEKIWSIRLRKRITDCDKTAIGKIMPRKLLLPRPYSIKWNYKKNRTRNLRVTSVVSNHNIINKRQNVLFDFYHGLSELRFELLGWFRRD